MKRKNSPGYFFWNLNLVKITIQIELYQIIPQVLFKPNQQKIDTSHTCVAKKTNLMRFSHYTVSINYRYLS